MSTDPDEGMDGRGRYQGMPLAALRQYVKGRCDDAERRRVEEWAAESVERRRYLDAMGRLYERAPAHSLDEAEGAWRRLAARLDPPGLTIQSNVKPHSAPWESTPVAIRVRPRRPRLLVGAFPGARRRYFPALLAGAGVLVALVGTALLRRIDSAHAPSPTPAAPTMRVVATTKGQRAEIRLADGSLIVLGVDSRLSLPSSDDGRARDLYLAGTAYFDVVHDSTRPIRIHTANALAEDIGTRFVVSAYPDSRATQVVVAAGAVTLEAARDSVRRPVTLTAGHLGRVTSAITAPAVRPVDPSVYTAWMQGRLVFDDTPLSGVVAELRRWYDVDLRIADPSLERVPLSASFTAESFGEALQVVTTVLPLRAVRHGRVVTLVRR